MAFIFFAIKVSYSQNYIELFKIHGSTTPLNTFDSSSISTPLNEFGLDATLPLKINSKSTIITGLIYETIQTKLFSEGKIENLSAISLKLGYSYKFNEKFTSTIIALPKIASNFCKLDDKDFQLGGIALFKYKAKENLHYKYGLYYNTERFGPFFVPMLGLYYLSRNNKFEANLMLPLQADINYKMIPLMSVGVNFNGQIRSYHVSHIYSGIHSAYVSRSTNEVYGYLKFNFGKNISCHTKVGQSFARKYRVYRDDDKVDFGMPLVFVGGNRKPLNTDFSDGLIFQLLLLYRLDINSK